MQSVGHLDRMLGARRSPRGRHIPVLGLDCALGRSGWGKEDWRDA